MSVAVVDYGAGNLLSLTRALTVIRADPQVITTPQDAAAAQILILPGVGAAGSAMRALDAHGISVWLRTTKLPILGICLGMQLLFETLEEDDCAGLGILSGSVRRLIARPDAKVPHMGWNQVTWADVPMPALHLYFAHSYHCEPNNVATYRTAWTDHGQPILAELHRPGIIGMQFHPEKSGAVGLNHLAAAVTTLRNEVRE